MSSGSDTSGSLYDPTRDEDDESDMNYSDESDASDGADHEDFIGDDMEAPDPADPAWHSVSKPFQDSRPIKKTPFTGEDAGITEEAGTFETPSSAFLAFLDWTLIGLICTWTNARAEQYFRAKPLNTKRKVNNLIWKPVAAGEMYVCERRGGTLGV